MERCSDTGDEAAGSTDRLDELFLVDWTARLGLLSQAEGGAREVDLAAPLSSLLTFLLSLSLRYKDHARYAPPREQGRRHHWRRRVSPFPPPSLPPRPPTNRSPSPPAAASASSRPSSLPPRAPTSSLPTSTSRPPSAPSISSPKGTPTHPAPSPSSATSRTRHRSRRVSQRPSKSLAGSTSCCASALSSLSPVASQSRALTCPPSLAPPSCRTARLPQPLLPHPKR